MALTNDQKDALGKQMAEYSHLNMLARNDFRADQRAKEKKLSRRLHLERREAENEEFLVRASQMKDMENQQFLQEQRLAQEMERIKIKDMKEKKLRQHLRENCEELKELESKLRNVYCFKEVCAQLAEQEAKRIADKKRDREAFLIVEKSRLDKETFEREKKRKEMLEKYKYKCEIQEQIIEQNQMKKCSYEEYLKEKKMIDDIVQRLHNEEMRDLELKMIRMKKTREEMEEFHKARELWRLRERKALDDENRRVVEYLEEQANKKDIEKEQNEVKAANKKRAYDIIVEMVTAKEKKDKEREDIIFTLLEEETRAKNEQQRIDDIEKKIRGRIEMRAALDMQRAIQADVLRQQDEIDKKFRDALMEQMAEDEKLEQMNDQKRRMRALEHGRAVQAMMEERRQQKAEEMQAQLKLEEEKTLEEQNRLRIIEEERIKILQEHIPELAGFIPNGILTKEDMELFAGALKCVPAKP